MIRRICLMLLVCLSCGLVPVRAAEETEVWNHARDFYDKYREKAVFMGISETDGEICFATRAGHGDVSVRYKTIGWKMNFFDEKNRLRQALYFSLNGDYIQLKDYQEIEDDFYNLYMLRLSVIRGRLMPEVLALMEQGRIHMLLDACVAVCREEKVSGTMSDEGITDGEVFTDYEGLLAAVNWSDGSKKTLRGYFQKEVAGMFLNVELEAGEGISQVRGSGCYCYGATVSLQAELMEGYGFLGWEGDMSGNGKEISMVVHRNLYGVAKARKLTPPTIWMGDLYLTAQELERQTSLEAWALPFGTAMDEEDGSVELFMKDTYREEEALLQLERNGMTVITLCAADTDEMVTEKEVRIYMINTEIKRGTAVTGRIRFISPRYFEDEDGRLVPSVAGGLMEDSVWRKENSYRNLLRNTLYAEIP